MHSNNPQTLATVAALFPPKIGGYDEIAGGSEWGAYLEEFY